MSLTKKYGPFTEEEIAAIKKYQAGPFHPFTCCSFDGCNRDDNNGGVLIPDEHFLRCPCGKYKQRWIWEEMIQLGRTELKLKPGL